ncbi:electron transfer flavoprotein subunit beta/FixA family protein [Leucobacter sp. HY1910]
MKIIVLVKEVPDTYGDRKLSLETGLAERDASEKVLDEICERALEVALSHADTAGDTEITVLSMGPDSAAAALRRALSMGAHAAIHITDDGLIGADLGLTARVLAAAITRQPYDLVLTGNLSTDGAGGTVPAIIAELLAVPLASGLSEITLTEDELSGVRPFDGGTQRLRATLPAVASVTEAFPDARFPNFKGIVAAKKKPLETLGLSDLGIEAEDWSVPHAIMLSVAERPARSAGVKIVDEGDAGQKIAEFLVANRLS